MRGAGRTDGGDQLARHGTDDPRRPRGCLRDTHVPTLDRLAVEPGEELAAVREPLLRGAERRHPGDDRVTRPVVRDHHARRGALPGRLRQHRREGFERGPEGIAFDAFEPLLVLGDGGRTDTALHAHQAQPVRGEVGAELVTP
ncbi:MAG: hypothetical protein E6K38_13620 [Gammaproteobacteria bacterium]|nr:MAG: hypothetical protein E6K38_13620 [Gammaproteobacteria bacterium]